MSDFRFLNPGKLVDGELELVLVEAFPADPQRDYVPVYAFEMRIDGRGPAIGQIHLRVGDNELVIRYAGHIGYRVYEGWRGHHYAARACRLILPLARRHGLRILWITCNPDNAASRRTCQRVGARYVETVDLPPETEMYQDGDRQKCRYRLELYDDSAGSHSAHQGTAEG